jgi:thymidylate kinase
VGQTFVIRLVRELRDSLAAADVAYCHWKSNIGLDRVASGDTDLDLLVSPSDADALTCILGRLGFRRACSPPGQELPGVTNYYAYDQEADRLVHVHVHYRLVVGDDMTKNYRLPLEEAFLASAVQGDVLPVPAPELELIVFVIRMVLKHSTWDAVLSGQRRIRGAERRELQYLESLVQSCRVHEVLRQRVPSIDAALFDRCVETLRPGCPLRERVRVAWTLQVALGAQARRPQLLDAGAKLRRRVSRAARRRLFGHPPRQHLAAGGAIIALVGGDGSGKSTAVSGLIGWLGEHLETARVHMGRPAWSPTTVAVRGALRVGRLLGLLDEGSAARPDGRPGAASGPAAYAAMLRAVCTARDRYLAYEKARRLARDGRIVICDRYPLPGHLRMDGPEVRLGWARRPAGFLTSCLARAEESYYRSITPADLLIVLRVDPEVAVRRKPTEDAATIRVRNQEIWGLDWRRMPVRVVDAGRPQPEVMSQIKSLIWSEL